MPDELFYRTATDVTSAPHEEVSATEVVQAHLDRIEAVNPLVNAIVTSTAEQALEADRGAARGEERGAREDPAVHRVAELLMFGDVAAMLEQEPGDGMDDAGSLGTAQRQNEGAHGVAVLSTQRRSAAAR